MKILQVSEDLVEEGGRSLRIIDLSYQLAAKGHDVHVISGPVVDASLAYRLHDAGIGLDVFECLGNRPCFRVENPGFADFVSKHVLQLQPDVAHTHGYGDMWAVSHTSLPYVSSVRVQTDWAREDRRAKFKELLNGSLCVISHGRNVTNDLLTLGIDANHIVTRASGIPNYGPQPHVHNWRGKPQLVCISRIDYNKGIDTLLKAMPLILQDFPDSRLALIGSGEDEETFRELSRELGIAEKIDWLGFQAKPVPFLGGCDLFLHPSRTDACASAVLEAISAEIPVCVSRASAEQVADGKYGEIHAVDDYEGLAEGALKILHDSNRLLRAKAGAYYISNRYSSSGFTEIALEAYQLAK
jgi:glycosyltransferase involved in cell wall biosynthesis